jgi:3-hydroxyisobutyrate dehydrogenase
VVEIGYVGLGAMGGPMAARLAGAFPTRVWNRTGAVAAAHAAAHGSSAVGEVTDLADVDVVCTCLPTDVEVAAVAEVLGPRLRPGTVWLDHTSGAPAGSREVARGLAAHDVTYLDAPVSGGTAGAEQGTLTVMVGGDPDALGRVTDVLAAVAARVVPVGPVGAGMAVKAVNNALLATSLWAAAEGLAALQAAGVPASRALEVVNASSGRSFATEVLIAERVVTRTFPPTFALALLAKDVGLARAVLAEQGVEAPVVDRVAALTAAAAEELGPAADHVELVRVVEAANGIELR